MADDPEAKITVEEMIRMFGTSMPVEAIDFIFSEANQDLTIGKVRAKLREMAAARGHKPLSPIIREPDTVWRAAHVKQLSWRLKSRIPSGAGDLVLYEPHENVPLQRQVRGPSPGRPETRSIVLVATGIIEADWEACFFLDEVVETLNRIKQPIPQHLWGAE